MVERTFSADSPHILVVYATPDGERYRQKERAFNRFGSDPGPTVTAAIDVDPASGVDRPTRFEWHVSGCVEWRTDDADRMVDDGVHGYRLTSRTAPMCVGTVTLVCATRVDSRRPASRVSATMRVPPIGKGLVIDHHVMIGDVSDD